MSRASISKKPLVRRASWATLVWLLWGAMCLGADPTKADRATSGKATNAKRMTVTSSTPALGSEYPPGTMRITTTTSAFDGAKDWALFLPGDPRRNTIVYLHGSFSHADHPDDGRRRSADPRHGDTKDRGRDEGKTHLCLS